jgi:hypothetical protein
MKQAPRDGDFSTIFDHHKSQASETVQGAWQDTKEQRLLVVQVYGIHAGACIAAFHTAVAVHYSNMTKGMANADSLPQHFDKCLQILRTAAFAIEELRSLRGPCTAIAKCLKNHLVEARSVLNTRLLECQQQQVENALLPALDFVTESANVCTFEVQLPDHRAPVALDSSSVREKSIIALAGVSPPPVHGNNPAAWCKWLQDLMNSHSMPWTTITLLLQHVEQHFFTCTELYLSRSALMSTSSISVCGAALSAADIEMSVELLQLYSQVVAKVEAWTGLWQSPGFSPASDYKNAPMLKVQLRSVEALLTWIVLCLVYQRVETQEWEGIRKYKLPVEPDELRHLVRGGNAAAQHAVTVVAEYICRVQDRSDGKVCFSLESAETLECVVDYASAFLIPADSCLEGCFGCSEHLRFN